MHRSLLVLLSALAAALAAALLPSLAAGASRFVVETTADTLDGRVGDGRCADSGGRCSLRAAISEGNASRDGARVVLRNRRYTLTRGGAGEDATSSGDLDVSGTITIVGGGALIDAARLDRAFDVAAGARLTIGRARIANGAPPAGQSGGAIESEGRVELKDVRVLKNAVQGDGASGGGLFNAGGTLIVRDTQVNRNSAPRAGGGIEANAGTTLLRRASLLVNTTVGGPGNGGALHLTGSGVVDVRDSLIDRNSASAEGGGLWNSAAGAMSVADTTITDNVASGADADQGGGGIFNDGGRLRVDRGTIARNQATGAAGSGGGLLNNLGTVLIDGTDVNTNSARRAGGGIEANAGSTSVLDAKLTGNATGAAPGNGGGLHLTGGGQVELSRTSVSGNSASAEGGGLWNSAAGTMRVLDTTVSGNRADGAAADQGGGGLFNDGGRLIVERGTVADNRAPGAAGSGGGILNDRGTLAINGTMIRGNSATRAGGGVEANLGSTTLVWTTLEANATGAAPGNGGGLHLTGAGTVAIRDGQVARNSAAKEGGGLWNSATGTMTVTGTTFSGNTAPSGADVFNQPPGGSFTLDGVPVPA